MNIIPIRLSEIARIGEIDRPEEIKAKYRCALSSDGDSTVLLRDEMDSPEQLPNAKTERSNYL
jgi:hypothetical protein